MKIIIVLLLMSFLSAYAFEIEKISEFSQSEVYNISRSGMVLSGDNLFTINQRSFQIFDVSENNLQLITDLNLSGQLSSLSIVDDFAYVASTGIDPFFYRIDIQNLYNPIVTDTLNYVGSELHFIDGNNIFVPEFLETFIIIHIFDHQTFEEIQQIDFFLFHAGDGFGFNWDDGIFNIYDITDISNITLINTDELTGLFNQFGKPTVFNNEILIMNFDYDIRIFDIVTPNEWNLISSIPGCTFGYKILSDTLYSYYEDHVSTYNIFDLTNPIQIAIHNNTYTEEEFISNICVDSNFLYYSTWQGAIKKYENLDSSFIFINSYQNCGWIYGCANNNDTVYISSLLGSLEQYNISDMYNPEYTTSYSIDNQGLGIETSSNYLTALQYHPPSHSWFNDIYEIENSSDLSLITTLDNPNNMGYKLYMDEESEKFFFVEIGNLHRFFLNSDNEIVEDALIQLPSDSWTGTIYINNNTAYLRLSDQLAILDNISNEDISVVNSIPLEEIIGIPNIQFFDNYMFSSINGPWESCIIYDVTNPTEPINLFEIENSGVIAIDEENELLFMGYSECEVYDLSNIEYGIVDQVGSFRNWSICANIITFQRDYEDYLLYLEDTSCSIYQYEYEPNGINNDLISISPQLTNYPNPFNPETKIAFNIPESGKVKVEIFNVKGQKVKTLDTFPNPDLSGGTREVVWDGTDENNQRVSTGVYFYQLEVDGKTVASRKMMLLK